MLVYARNTAILIIKMNKLIAFGMTSVAAAAAASITPVRKAHLLARQDDCGAVGAVQCYDTCIPVGSICCKGGGGCNADEYCDNGGCCPIGKICSGSGGTETQWIGVSSTIYGGGGTSTSTSALYVTPIVTPTSTSRLLTYTPIPPAPVSPSSHSIRLPSPSPNGTFTAVSPPVFTGGAASLDTGLYAVGGLFAGLLVL